MTQNDVENHMIIGNDTVSTQEFQLQQQREVAHDIEVAEALDLISQSGELDECFPVLDCTRLEFYERVREELAQLDVGDIATISECKVNDNNVFLLIHTGNVIGAAVERVKTYLKEKAEIL